MKKRREMKENKTHRDHIEYVEICKTIKKKAKEDIRKHNLDEIRETIDSIHGQRNPHRERGLAGKGNGCFAEFCCCPCDLRYSSNKDISFHRFPGDNVAGRECIFKSRRDMPLLWKICR